MAPEYKALKDEELALLARSKDHEAFAELTARYLGLIRGKAAQFQGAALPERDDLLQEGFLGLYFAVMGYEPGRGSTFHAFAGVCVQNRMADAVRRHAGGKNRPLNESVPLEEAMPADSSPEELLELRERLADFQTRVESQLSPLEKTALSLYLSGCKREDIPKLSGMELKAYDNALYRVRSKLKKI